MDAQELRNLQEAYLEVYGEAYKPFPKGKVDKKMASKVVRAAKHQVAATWGDKNKSSENQEKANKLGSQAKHMAQISTEKNKEANSWKRGVQSKHRSEVKRKIRYMDDIARQQRERGYGGSAIKKEEVDIYDIILSHLLDEGYAETPEAAEVIMVNMSEEWRDTIIEREDSPYEKASDAALDKRYGYGRASGDKRSFGRAANRSSAAAALRAIRRGERSGSGTSREAGADAVHQGWARTAKTSTDQTPEKKERRAKLANTSYSNLPDDEKEKDRVSFDAVRATYNNRNR